MPASKKIYLVFLVFSIVIFVFGLREYLLIENSIKQTVIIKHIRCGFGRSSNSMSVIFKGKEYSRIRIPDKVCNEKEVSDFVELYYNEQLDKFFYSIERNNFTLFMSAFFVLISALLFIPKRLVFKINK